MDADLILASQSPRRADLLAQLGVRFHVCPAHIDETPSPGEDPAHYVARMAREKALAVAASPESCESDASQVLPVLGADTTVVLDGRSMGKPADAAAARRMLNGLSGRSHAVLSAVCLAAGEDCRVVSVATEVTFCKLSPELIEAYIASDEPWDKAGGYGIQGLAGALVRAIDGSYSNVVGLPLAETRELLQAAGVPTALSGRPAPVEASL